ncbi:hypothetical protein SUDANB15_04216 [Streptomyces sp. enrichment culture]
MSSGGREAGGPRSPVTRVLVHALAGRPALGPPAAAVRHRVRESPRQRGQRVPAADRPADRQGPQRADRDQALTVPDSPSHDRFTGRPYHPEARTRRDFAELTAANELDLARIDPAFRERWGADLRALFTRLGPLLSPAARRECHAVLGGEG